MGNPFSKKKKKKSQQDEVKSTPVTAYQEDDQALAEGDDYDDVPDCAPLLTEVAHKVTGIREKAQDYHEYLLKKVVDIEQAAAISSSAEPQTLRENGTILVAFGKDVGNAMLQESSADPQDSQFLQVEPGDKVEIVMRESGGWAYCRKQCGISGVAPEAPELGWVPSAGVAELAVLIADHEVTGDGDRMLAAKQGDTVEVVSRHYSGWALCREWHGIPKEGETPRHQGWVTDAYLEDRRSAAALATKWHRLVLEALERVVSTAKTTETMLEGVKGQELKGDESMEWMGKCLEFTQMLAQELQYITQAVSQHDIDASSHGRTAKLQWDVLANSEHELGGSAGDRVVIVNAEYNEWIWCSSSSSRKTGWVPRNVLIMEDGDAAENLDQSFNEDIELPDWIKENQECRWLSKSNQRFYDVTIRSVNYEEQKIEVVFVIDTTCWKHVPFDHFLSPPEEWLLQPLDEKSKELRSQLPDWVQNGRAAFWWSDSQKRCMAVHIQEVDGRKRMIYVNFDVDPNARKHVPFHQLIDDPDKCLLQADKKKHAWRKKQPSKASVGSSTKSEDDAFQQAEGLRMTSLMNDIVEDVGDMLGPDAAQKESKTGGGISFSDRVKNEMLALPPSELQEDEDDWPKDGDSPSVAAGKDTQGSEMPKTLTPSWAAAGLPAGATLEDSLVTEHPLEASIGPRDGALGSSKAGALADRIAALAKAAAAPDDTAAIGSDAAAQPASAEAAGTAAAAGAQDGQAAPFLAEASQQAVGTEAKEELPEGIPMADNYLGEGKEAASAPAFGGMPVADAIQTPTDDLLSRGAGLGTASAEHELTKKVAKVDVVDYSQSEEELMTRLSDGDADEKEDKAVEYSHEEADLLSDLMASIPQTPAVGKRSAAASGAQASGAEAAAASGAEAAAAGVEAAAASPEELSPSKSASSVRMKKGIDQAFSDSGGARAKDESGSFTVTAAPEDGDAAPEKSSAFPGVNETTQEFAAGGFPPIGGTSLAASGSEDLATSLPPPGRRQGADQLLNLNLGLDSEDTPEPASKSAAHAPSKGERKAKNKNKGASKANGRDQILNLNLGLDDDDDAGKFGAHASAEDAGQSLAKPYAATLDPFSLLEEDADQGGVQPGTQAGRSGTHAEDGAAGARVQAAGGLGRAEVARGAAGTAGGRTQGLETNVVQVRSAEPKAGLDSTLRFDELGQTMGEGPAPWFNPQTQHSPLNDDAMGPVSPAAHEPKPELMGTINTVGSLASEDSDAASSALRITGFGSAMPPRADSDGPAPKHGWGTMEGFHPMTHSKTKPELRSLGDTDEQGGAWMGETPLFRKRPAPGWGEEAEAEDDGDLDSGLPLQSLDPSRLAREALRVLDPDTWDSEAEAGVRRPPDTKVLAKAWDTLEGHLDEKLAADAKPFDVELEELEQQAVHEIRRVAEDVNDKLEFKARGSMGNFNEDLAANYRAKAWEVMQNADRTLSLRAEAKEARKGLRKRKRKGRKESVQRAVGEKPSDVAGAWFVPDSQALMDLSSSGAVAEVSESAWDVLRAVEVVALRPPKGRVKAWHQAAADEGKKSKRRDESGPLREACEAVAKSLSASLEALSARLAREQDETPQVDASLEAVVKGDEGLSKEAKRDKALFEGQQEFDWERKLHAKVKQAMRNADAASEAAKERVGKVLQRRWRRGYQRDRAQTLGAVAALARAVAEAEEALDSTWRKHQEKAAQEASELEHERRRVHGQTRLLLSAALVIREEKDRMSKAYSAATVAQKQKLMRKSLKRVRRLNNELKSMEVLPELKQNHSVLLYSLRMLEARLSSEVPGHENLTFEEGSLEEQLSSGGQLAEIDRTFQEQLTADLSALESTHDGQARRSVAKMARGFVRQITEEHGKSVPMAREAIEISMQSAQLAELANLVMRPFAVVAAGLMPEASRHAEVSQSKFEASTLAPPTKRQLGALKETLEAIESLRPALLQVPEMGAAASQAAAKYRDRDWEDAVNATEQQWRSFCDAHPLVADDDDEPTAAEGPQTPRVEEEVLSPTTASSCGSPPNEPAEGRAQLELRQALELDDLENQSQAGVGASPKSTAGGRARPKTGRERAKAPSRPPPGGPSLKERRSMEQKKPEVPKSRKSRDNKATALLAQLDELSQTMDTALAKSKKTAKASRPSGGAAPPAPPPTLKR